MVHVMVRHKVADYVRWKEAFDGHLSARKAAVSACISGDNCRFCARAGMEMRATIIAVIDKRRQRIGSLPYDNAPVAKHV